MSLKDTIRNIILEEYNRSDYLKWKRKNVTVRGIKELGKENNVYGSLGRGLYTAFLSNKSMAREYGKVYFVVGAIPEKPKVFRNFNEWEIFYYNTLITNFLKSKGKYKDNEMPDRSFFEQETTIEDEMMKLGYDGIVIKGREMVNYKPDEDEIRYFENERQLEMYFEYLYKNNIVEENDMTQKTIEGFVHEKPITFNFVKVVSDYIPKGNEFLQKVEPKGTYITYVKEKRDNHIPDMMVTGVAKLNKPLLIEFGGLYNEKDNWKRVLSKRYNNLKGERLSNALKSDGYDAVVTYDEKGYVSEIVVLYRDRLSFHKNNLGFKPFIVD